MWHFTSEAPDRVFKSYTQTILHMYTNTQEIYSGNTIKSTSLFSTWLASTRTMLGALHNADKSVLVIRFTLHSTGDRMYEKLQIRTKNSIVRA